jgi:nicotinate (nicotinamide) nucleotide adenylyltransferase
MARKQVGILGSAFDPPHYAHAAMAVLALQQGSLDEVWLCPSPNRWDKTPVAPLDTRIRWAHMLAQRLCSMQFPVQVSTDELSLKEYRGSYVFLKHLSNMYTSCDFRPIVGLDAWQSIHLWRDPVTKTRNGELLKNEFSFLIFPRGHDSAHAIDQPHLLMPSLQERNDDLEILLACKGVSNLSSSAVRNAIAENRPLSFAFSEIEQDVRNSFVYARRA